MFDWDIERRGCQGNLFLKSCVGQGVIDSQVDPSREALDVWRGNGETGTAFSSEIGDKTKNICAKCWARNSGWQPGDKSCHILHRAECKSRNQMQKYFSISQENIMRTEYIRKENKHHSSHCRRMLVNYIWCLRSLTPYCYVFSGNGLTRRSEIITK